eukprot:s5796_g1.t1
MVAWHSVTSAFTLCGRRGTYGTGLALAAALVAAGPGLAPRPFAWQGRRSVTSAFTLCGRRGTSGTGLALAAALVAAGPGLAPRPFCVAGVALGDICLPFVWQAWHSVTSAFTLCGRRGTYGTGLAWRHLPSFCVAGVALGDICLHFVWQAWHLRHWAGSVAALVAAGLGLAPRPFAWQAWHSVTSAFTLCGRRGAYGSELALAAALVAAGPGLAPPFAWQAWHLATSAFVLCGRRGTR